ncbi:AAA family ATPase [Bacillus salitolerans]|uniref:AAA family ATPase n=1 Tax=Bacillus salitolerans TaxID=1437434 RepID=A0ABW4LRV7_9BACI
MMCQKCQQNQATVQMNVQVNQQRKQLHLCTECYAFVKQPFNAQFNSHSSNIDDFFKQFFSPSPGQAHQEMNQNQQRIKQNGFLDQHGKNLTNEAKQGRIDLVIGRDKEVERLIEVLNRRTKNNPVLIGEAGVGKTAIVEGFALKITEGTVPKKLRNKQVYTLDINSLVAGTSYRGQFEENMKQLVEELQKRDDIILFIDELHMVVGAGSTSEGSMDAANILKPALARGDMQIIGATTLKEYRIIEKDPALERRFQPIIVKEPTVDEAFEILKGIRPIYESYHDVQYSNDVLKACVTLSNRYIQDRYLPDKAIDLLDEAGSQLNLDQVETDKGKIQQRLDEITKLKTEASTKEDYETAAKLRDEENQLRERLETTPTGNQSIVTIEHIQAIIESKTGIPVRKLQESEQAKLKDLQARLMEKIIGQEIAVEKVAKAIRRGRAGLKSKTRPTASFLFVGPTGTGKTELTKTLAAELFGSKDAMIRLDMSEYMEKHSVSKLIGSPPGYVGHEEAGQLTEKVRRNPYSILLLDEVEKAHPDVLNMFLQIMEDGRLTDSQGRVTSFRDTVIIMTSNAGTSQKKKGELGFGTNTTDEYMSILESLGDYFRPEFLNRFDSIIEFKHLEKESILKIVDIMLSDLIENLKEQGITIEIASEAKVKIAELGYSSTFGARPLRRVIQEIIEDGIADLIIDNEKINFVTISLIDDQIVVA